LFNESLVESPLCNPSTLVRRSALDQVGPWHEGDFPEDWQHWLRFLEQGHRLTCLPEVLHRWRDSDTRLTRTLRSTSMAPGPTPGEDTVS